MFVVFTCIKGDHSHTFFLLLHYPFLQCFNHCQSKGTSVGRLSIFSFVYTVLLRIWRKLPIKNGCNILAIPVWTKVSWPSFVGMAHLVEFWSLISALHTAHPDFSRCTQHCTVHTIHPDFSGCTQHCTLHTIHPDFSRCTQHCTLHTVHPDFSRWKLHCTVHSAHYTSWFQQVKTALHSAHYTLHTIHPDFSRCKP